MPSQPIEVLFIDADSGETLFRSGVPADALPDSFAVDTTVHVAEEPYQVVSAEPAARAGYEQAGTLRLQVRKVVVTQVDPRTLLYSLPTLADPLPQMAPGASRRGLRILELHEDDWRQLEVVSATLSDAIERDLAAVAAIHRDASRPLEGGGAVFSRLHVRADLPEPLPGTALTLAELRRRFPAAAPRDGLGLRDAPGLVAGGFVLGGEDACLYGVEDGGAIRVLGLRLGGAEDLGAFFQAIADLLAAHCLVLVDWCGARSYDPDALRP